MTVSGPVALKSLLWSLRAPPLSRTCAKLLSTREVHRCFDRACVPAQCPARFSRALPSPTLAQRPLFPATVEVNSSRSPTYSQGLPFAVCHLAAQLLLRPGRPGALAALHGPCGPGSTGRPWESKPPCCPTPCQPMAAPALACPAAQSDGHNASRLLNLQLCGRGCLYVALPAPPAPSPVGTDGVLPYTGRTLTRQNPLMIMYRIASNKLSPKRANAPALCFMHGTHPPDQPTP